MNKNNLIFILFSLTVISFLFQIFLHLDKYTTPYDYAYFADRYVRSQYVLSENATNIINDYDLYAYAGYYYVTGGEVNRVNFENPPLGKYLIGLSIILFHNHMVIYLIYGIIFLFLTYKFALLIFKNQTVAVLSMLVLTLDPYFHQAIFFSLLDFPMSIFFLSGIYLFLKANKWQCYVISSFFFGLAISTKFFPSFFLILIYLTAYQILFRKKHLLPFLLSLLVSAFVYLMSYSQYLLNSSLWEFIKFQWWVMRWRMGNPVVLGNGFLTMFLGKFRPWWPTNEKLHSYTAEWSLIIPVISGLTLASIFFFKKNKLFNFVYGLVILTLIYINLATEGGLKYLTPIYPFLIIFAINLILKITKLIDG